MRTKFQTLYVAWMRRRKLAHQQAALLIGSSLSTSYAYAAGESQPPHSRLAYLAKAMGLRPRALQRAVERDAVRVSGRGSGAGSCVNRTSGVQP